MNQLFKAVRHYYLFSCAFAIACVALILELLSWHLAAHILLAITIVLELMPFFGEIWQDLRDGKYGVDILAAVAIISSLVLGQYWTAIVIVLMLTGGRALEDYAGHRAESELTALLSRAPQQAHIIRGRKEVTVKASDVHAGDKIVIRPGELVPVDAVILEGTANFDESSLTGESLPQAKTIDAQLLSGSVNLDGPVTAKVIHAAEDSQYQQIIRLVRAAQHSQAPFTRLADRYALPFTVISFAIALAAWDVGHHAIRFLEVIVVATPCPLILAVPIAIISGMSRSAKQGIIIKNGTALEKLARAKTFGFDKTGTLTEGSLTVERITTFGKTKRTDLLGLAASVEQHSNHAQATALIARANAEHAKLATVKNVHEIAGKGLIATIKGNDVVIGRYDFLKEQHVVFPKTFKTKDYNQTAAFIATDGSLAGAITFADDIRQETKYTLQKLRSLGIKHMLMVTGDNPSTAKSIAKKLGITDVVAGALPADKISAIEHIKERPVAFIGDGVNDAPVLTASDVGIALGARGAAAASESADIVIVPDDLMKVAEGVAIAHHTFKIAKQSMLTGIALSVLLMLIFATGHFMPIYGAALQEIVDIVVIFNALRAHTGRLELSKPARP